MRKENQQKKDAVIDRKDDRLVIEAKPLRILVAGRGFVRADRYKV